LAFSSGATCPRARVPKARDAEQIVAREPRERVSQDAFVIQCGPYRAAA